MESEVGESKGGQEREDDLHYGHYDRYQRSIEQKSSHIDSMPGLADIGQEVIARYKSWWIFVGLLEIQGARD